MTININHDAYDEFINDLRHYKDADAVGCEFLLRLHDQLGPQTVINFLERLERYNTPDGASHVSRLAERTHIPLTPTEQGILENVLSHHVPVPKPPEDMSDSCVLGCVAHFLLGTLSQNLLGLTSSLAAIGMEAAPHRMKWKAYNGEISELYKQFFDLLDLELEWIGMQKQYIQNHPAQSRRR